MALVNDVYEGFEPIDGAQTSSRLTKLSQWDQASVRSYMTVVLCFPTGNSTDSHDKIFNYIKEALGRLAISRPDFAGRLVLGGANGESRSNVYLHTSPSGYIPFEVMTAEVKASYDELKKDGFPASAFVKPEFTVCVPLLEGTAGQPVPVSQVRLLYVKGGFLLFVYFHHTYGDGSCLDVFLNLLASETSKAGSSTNERTSCCLDLPCNTESQKPFDNILAGCPEYGLLPGPTGPTQPILPPLDRDCGQMDSIGKTFVIDSAKLESVCRFSKTGKVSKFFALAALTWAHTTKARLASDPLYAAGFAGQKPIFWNPHDWAGHRKKLLPDNDSVKRYFGNSVALAVTRDGVESAHDLVDACDWEVAAAQGRAPTKVLEIAERMVEANCAIDEDFVLARTALFASAPDIRRLGLALDARPPHNFSFNTWGFVGRNARFWLPGTGPEDGSKGEYPDAIRRVQGAWALPHGLILPRRPEIGRDELELVVTLPAAAMEQLERDETWMTLVKRVIG